jgi:tRNA modification GTPase
LSTAVFSRQRHRDAIERALKELHQYESMIDSALAAQTLRNALYHVGCIVGHVHNEQLLDLIFAEFCIGK